jgi:hypothetical protein
MNPPQEVYLFEFDERFSMYGAQFVRYDYRTPIQFMDSDILKGTFDFIVADPPFLSDECCTKLVNTIRWLERKNACKIMVCTGECRRTSLPYPIRFEEGEVLLMIKFAQEPRWVRCLDDLSRQKKQRIIHGTGTIWQMNFDAL